MKPKVALFISVGAHLLVGIAIGVSISFSDTQPLTMPNPSVAQVQATFIDAQAIYDKQKAQQAAQAKEEARRRQREQQARERREREKRKKASEQARKKQEQAQKEQARKQREQRALEKRRQEELEIQRRLEEERKREAQLQKELEEQLQQEQEAMRAAQRERVMSEVDKYRALIYQTIYQNLFIDDNAKGKECELRVKLASNGLVISVDVLGGEESLCIAARAAVLRPETLPVSKDPAVFEEMKSLRIRVTP